jgi:glycosyltransferase involved in cell wall biosynthesis
MSTPVGSICLAANDLAYIVRSGSIGTYYWELAHVLAHAGWRVHVLYCGPVEDAGALADVPRRLAKGGIGFSDLDALTIVGNRGIETIFPGEPAYLIRSEKVRCALEELHREHHFDLVEFAESGAVGFRTIQAKRAGSAFQEVETIVKLHGSSQWGREGNLAWMAKADDSRLDFCERYAFENASIQVSPSRYMLDYASSIHWKVQADARVVPYPSPEAMRGRQGECGWAALEIVFFGRLELRKGLEVFIEAAKRLDPRIRLSFVGKDTLLASGAASTYIKAQLKGREVSVLTDLNSEQALAYLSKGSRLAVMPSLTDNFPYTVIECAVNGIPFLASNVGGIPEILPEPEVRARLLFEPNSHDLIRCLEGYLKADPSQRRALSEQVQTVIGVPRNNRQVVDCYSQMLQSRSTRPSVTRHFMDDNPLVTVCVTFYNLGAYLPETLASLAAQTYSTLEVLVINDGSTDAASIRVFEEQLQLYPQFRFVSQANAGVEVARNRGMAEATGEYFIPIDADNIAAPNMVERFVAGIRRRPDLAALSCYFLAFEETPDIARGNFSFAYRPTGGSHVMGSIENVYGDTTSVYRTATLHTVGGYETDRDTGFEDWELFIKLVNAGCRVDVLPEYLFYYRRRGGSRGRTTNSYRNHQRVLRQYFRGQHLPESEQMALWTALVSLHFRLTQYHDRQSSRRYRVADELNDFLEKFPRLSRLTCRLLLFSWKTWKRISSGLRRRS